MTIPAAFINNKAVSTQTQPQIPMLPRSVTSRANVAQTSDTLRNVALSMSENIEGSASNSTPTPRAPFNLSVKDLKNCSHVPTFTLEELESTLVDIRGNATAVIERTQSTLDNMRKKGEDAAHESVDRIKHSPDPLIEFGQEIAHNVTKDLPEPGQLLDKSRSQLNENKYGKAYQSALAAFGVQALKQLGLKGKTDEATETDSSNDS